MKNLGFPSALRFTPLNIFQSLPTRFTVLFTKTVLWDSFCSFILRVCSFILLSYLLFFAACTDTQNLVTAECEPESEEPNHYTEYEGTMSLTHDLVGIYLEHSDQPERDEFIDIRWSLGEHIYVVSEKFEFDDGDCLIWGSMGCQIWDAEVKEEIIDDKGVTWLYFEPADDFWDCLELDGGDPGMEVFDFHLMAR